MRPTRVDKYIRLRGSLIWFRAFRICPPIFLSGTSRDDLSLQDWIQRVISEMRGERCKTQNVCWNIRVSFVRCLALRRQFAIIPRGVLFGPDELEPNFDVCSCGEADSRVVHVSRPLNPFTPKSDQVQISPVASPVILHHTVWRTWLFIAYSDWKMILVPVLTTIPHLYISLEKVGRMYFLSLGLKGLNRPSILHTRKVVKTMKYDYSVSTFVMLIKYRWHGSPLVFNKLHKTVFSDPAYEALN